jgi:hypothetical protein
VLIDTILPLGVLADVKTRTLAAYTQEEDAGRKINAVADSREEQESSLTPTSLTGTKWPVENPETRALGEWIEFGRKLGSASDEELLSLIGSVVTYLEDKVDDEATPSTHHHHSEYVRGYARTILKAAQGELAKRHPEGFG